MIKVWLLFLMISNPGLPSVKTQSFLYADEDSCMTALADYLNIYEAKPLKFKNNISILWNTFTLWRPYSLLQ